MQDFGSVLVKEKNVDKHRNFNKQLFERDAGWKIKLILSSYTFMDNGGQGFPDGKSDCSTCIGDHCKDCSKSMKKATAYDASSYGYDCVKDGQWQQGAFTRVHRD